MQRRWITRSAGLLSAAALAASVAACGSSDGSDKASGGNAEAPAAKTIDGSLGAQFSGGKAGTKAAGEPISIGLINQEGGQTSDPEVRVAAEAAFAYINAQQGGVGGRPLKLVTCNIVSAEEQGQKCAQQFLNDANVDVIMQGGLNVGAQAVHQTIDGKKPTIITLANPGPDAVAKNTYAMNPGALAAIPTTSSYVNGVLKAQNVAMISGNNAGDLEIVKLVKGAVESGGAKVKLATFPSSSTDLVSPLTAAGANSADATMPIVVTPPACIATAKAVQQLAISKPVVGASLCATTDIKKALGDYPKWTYNASTISLDAPDDTGQVDFYKSVMEQYAGKDAQVSVGAPYAFGAAFALAKILNTVGAEKLSPETISSATKAFTGPVLLGSPKLKFGSVEGMPALGSVAGRLYAYEGGGKWTPKGDWLNLPV